ncbi:hypothetical protein A8709_25470 [Paenibacillus pectinilyticus]|uniref:Uncharacterized protein n=1 Tax=Paenibacillus pectinilyticus TaxID=512399 RepID=A0A1C1A0W3_9BACL|nr:hypothetical protein [Paenibacillus pectinilyticus]OCT14187.1 hypothetical protein A8709_25470 [Paenibacillus pectinilyticus]
MAIYTPQGLIIRLDVPTSFGLMARLYPEVRPQHILKTTEAISLMSSSLGFVTGLVCFLLHLSPQNIGICTLFAMVLGIICNASGIILVPFVQLGAAFRHIYVFFVPTIIAIVVGYLLIGWQGVIAFLLTRGMAACLSLIVGMGLARYAFDKKGYSFTWAERNFFNAYRYHAELIGKSKSVELSYEELDEAFWRATYQDFIQNYPEGVQRIKA